MQPLPEESYRRADGARSAVESTASGGRCERHSTAPPAATNPGQGRQPRLEILMMKAILTSLSAAACLALCGTAAAQAPAATKPLSTSLGMVAFPAKGQGAEQQARDEGECYAWSKGQTGVDPMAPPPAAAAPATPPAQQGSKASGSRLRGAARGAAAGAVIGEVANDDASEGAAIGATVGVLKGGAESRKQQAEAQAQAAAAAEQQASQQQAAQGQQLDLFKKGFAACLEPKGYTVK
jgi:hypothetical protein